MTGAVRRFGRLGRFDFLAMVGNIGLAEIAPTRAYLSGATGPLKGAKLLFGEDAPAAVLDKWLVDLNGYLDIGMQVIEDSLCNWQKSPSLFVQFRG